MTSNCLQRNHSSPNSNPKIGLFLRSMSLELKNLRGESLIRKAYVDYPHYASRSRIVSELLSSEELNQVMLWWNTDQSPRLFTIGYEGLTIDASASIVLDVVWV